MTKTLTESVAEFYHSNLALEDRMYEMAKTFLFGGYINVRDEFHIYLRTVEFYYHEETGSEKDPIMYHRNNNTIAGEIPYFPSLSFNSHDIGVDITFENPDKNIRASVLIRSYEILDIRNDQKYLWLWNPKTQRFEKEEYNYRSKKYPYNTQCMYVKKFLNGFASNSVPDVTWQPVLNSDQINDADIKRMKRQGVYYSPNKEKYEPEKGKRDEREWGFRREKELELK